MQQSQRKMNHTSLPQLPSPSGSTTSSQSRYFIVASSNSEDTSHQMSSMYSSEGICRSPTRNPQLPPKSPLKSPQLPPKSPLRSPQMPKSPLKSPQLHSPQMKPLHGYTHSATGSSSSGSTVSPKHQQNYFDFSLVSPKSSNQDIIKSPSKLHMKAFSQTEEERRKRSEQPKTVLTKTQSEPRSSVKFEVNNQPVDLMRPQSFTDHNLPFNIRTNPGYLIQMQSRNNSLESSETLITMASSPMGTRRCSSATSRPTTKSARLQQCRKSTSDLTQMTDVATTPTTPTNQPIKSYSRSSSPRRRGSMKAGLAYLASRRGSKDSTASINEEDIGPLNFQQTQRMRNRRTSNFLELPVPDHIRPRVCSLPEKAYNPRLSDDLYRLRTFSITNKGGVVNCGDSIINRRSRSNTSVNSTASRHSALSQNGSPYEGASSCCSGYNAVDSSSVDSDGTPRSLSQDDEVIQRYRVVLLGDSGVGKTALVSQFMTSEYMNTYDASLDDEFGEKTVSVLLDGEESEMVFIDHPTIEMSVENSLATYEPHACVVVYSIVQKESFKVAEDILNYLWRENYTREKSVIVVGNKADLARSRVISANDGKALAISRDCKFIETSSGIQHNVDELLVGILKQIRLREARDRKKTTSTSGAGNFAKSRRKLHGSKTSLSLNIAREILHKMCLNDISKSKSCENLHVL